MDSVIAQSKMLAGPKNYKIWRSTIQSILEREDLWEVVSTTKKLPQNTQSRLSSAESEADSGT